MLLGHLTLDLLKGFLRKYKLRVSGTKATLATRLAEELYRAYTEGDGALYNAMVDEINASSSGRHIWNIPGLLPKYIDPQLQARADAACRDHQFEILNLASDRYQLAKSLSNPVYFPLLPEAFEGRCVLKFDYTRPAVAADALTAEETLVILAVARVHRIAPSPAEGSVEYRFSKGHLIKSVTANGQPVCFDPSTRPHFIVLDRHLREGPNTVAVRVSKPRVPYYVQVIQVTHDPTKFTTVPAAKVKQTFLVRSKAVDIAETRIQLSLRCPLSMVKLRTPVRFEDCTHLQCLELSAWLAYAKPSRQCPPCPICAKAVQPDNTNLIIDGFMQEILAAVDERVAEVVLDVANGLTWSAAACPSAQTRLVSPTKPPPTETIWIDLTDDNTIYDAPWEQPARVKQDPGVPLAHTKTSARPAKRRVNEVDLTEDPASLEAATIQTMRLLATTAVRRNAGRTFDDPIELD